MLLPWISISDEENTSYADQAIKSLECGYPSSAGMDDSIFVKSVRERKKQTKQYYAVLIIKVKMRQANQGILKIFLIIILHFSIDDGR